MTGPVPDGSVQALPDRADRDGPGWFERALATPFDTLSFDVDGVAIHARAWGPAGGPALILIHGAGANSHWWDHVAPLLATNRRVVALDLAGHGDSGRQEVYSYADWARQAYAVAAATGDLRTSVILGHSMGGAVTRVLASRYGDALFGVTTVDWLPSRTRPGEVASRLLRGARAAPGYPTRAEAIRRFRPRPEQPCVLPYVRRHIAANSVTDAGGAWSWKFDPRIYLRAELDVGDLSWPACRVSTVLAEHGSRHRPGALIPTTIRDNDLVFEIPDAGHHIMLDQPLALVAALRAQFAAWYGYAETLPTQPPHQFHT